MPFSGLISLKQSKSTQKLSLFTVIMTIIGGQTGDGIPSLITAYSYSRIATFANDDSGSYFEDFCLKSFFNAFP